MRLFYQHLPLFLILLVLVNRQLLSQSVLPVLRSETKSIDVRDGNDFKKGYWGVSPEIRPDIFSAERFRGSKTVTFYSDMDSISFLVSPGNTYDFVIVLANGDSAFTQITTVKPSPPPIRLSNAHADTIPFKLGWNNAIRFQGAINGSDKLDMIFDTGANGVILSADALSKNLRLTIDGDIESFGIGGVSHDKLSRRNKMSVGNISWDSVNLVVKYSGKPNADVVIGYNAFDGKILEIDYDSHLMIVHRSLPAITGYKALPLVFRSGLSFIDLAIHNGTKIINGLFDFDTGSSESAFIASEFAAENGLPGNLKKSGRKKLKGSGDARVEVGNYTLPYLEIAGNRLSEVPVVIEKTTTAPTTPFNIIGNDVLKRMNIIIDYKADSVYLKPNQLLGSMYTYNKIRLVLAGAGLLFLILIGTLILWIRKRKRMKLQQSISPLM